ncbi:hypothetical protein GF386_01040 [Candidatus Pacearchaeota archaeon]|nr:hypothetical protein [Candidatus Pacearchaeota archaeon]MBD3282819.1 hypothetical protein [Candidatus Pacearchaeota archaeon]
MISRTRSVETCFNGRKFSFSVVSVTEEQSEDISLGQHVVLTGCEDPTPEEQVLIREQRKLRSFSRLYQGNAWRNDDEIRFEQLVESVERHPAGYLHPSITLSYEQRIA